jgi:hypothetical protein
MPLAEATAVGLPDPDASLLFGELAVAAPTAAAAPMASASRREIRWSRFTESEVGFLRFMANMVGAGVNRVKRVGRGLPGPS